MSSLEKVVGKEYVARFNKKGITTFEGLMEFYDNSQEELYLFLFQIEENDLARVELNLRIEKAASQYMLEYIDNHSQNLSTSEDKKPFYKKKAWWIIMLFVFSIMFGWKYYKKRQAQEAYNKKTAESFNVPVEEGPLYKSTPEDSIIIKKLEGEWKVEKAVNSLLTKKEKRDLSKIQLMFSEKLYRAKKNYGDYGKAQRYYISNGKFYEGTYSPFDSIWFNNDKSMTLLYSMEGFGKIELFFKKIK